MRKYLSVEEECRLHNLLLNDCTEDGQLVGVLLMASMGLRNKECCEVCYGDIDRANKNLPLLFVPKIGDKLRTDRILPIPDCVYQFLMKRRKYAKIELEESGKYNLQNWYASVDQLPIVCYGKEWTEKCFENNLKEAGLEVLHKAQVDDAVIEHVTELMRSNDEIKATEGYKDATAYLLRTTLGTSMMMLGFSQMESEYFLGLRKKRDMSSWWAQRTDLDFQHDLKALLERRALYGSRDSMKRLCVNKDTMMSDELFQNIASAYYESYQQYLETVKDSVV